MELFLLVIRSEVIIVSRVSERNNDYVASDRSEVSEHVNASFTQQEHQYKQQAEKCLLFLLFPSLLAVSNVRFSKIAIFVIFTNLTHQLSLFFSNLLPFGNRLKSCI